MTVPALTSPIKNTSAVSLRERSNADLMRAIHSPSDEAYVLERARICLKAFFDPDMSDQDRAKLIDEFGRALRNVPRWAVARAFDTWMKVRTRRPSPGDINTEAQTAIRELTDELARRKRMEEPPEPERARPDASAVTKILRDNGFTPKRMEVISRAPMARSMEEAEAQADAPPTPHWSETADPDGPEMRALRAIRDANPIIQATRRHQAQVLKGDQT